MIKQYFNKETFNKYLYYFICIITLIFITYIVKFYSFHHVIEYDDASIISNNSIIYKYFINVYKAKYIANFLTVFFGFDLPHLLGIHPVVWIQTGGAVIKGILFALLSFSIASGLFIFKRKNLFYHIITIAIFFYIQTTLLGNYESELYASFYCFTFQCLFFCLFWQKFITFYLSTDNVNNNQILVYIYAFILGTSSEMTSFSSLISISIFLVYTFFKERTKVKKVLLPFIFMLIGFFVYILHPLFFSNVTFRGTFDGHTLENAMIMFPEFINGYINVFINHFLIFTLLILIFTIFIYKQKKCNIHVLFISFLLGFYIFYSMLLFAGRGPGNCCFVNHFDLIYQMKYLLLSTVLMQISFFFDKKYIFYGLSLVFISYLLFTQYPTFKQFTFPENSFYKINNAYNDIDVYKNHYIQERIAAYYLYSNIHEFVLLNEAGKFSIYPYLETLYNNGEDINHIEYSNDYKYVYESYLNSGGCEISDQDISNADFQKLLDKNYILTCK